MKVILVDDQGQEIFEPYILRIQGWTEERYYRESPQDRKCEFVKGELIMVAAMSKKHSDITGFLYFLLKGYCDSKDLGKVLLGPTIRLENGVNREPDICFLPKDKLEEAGEMPIVAIPPFIIEISHTTQSMDLGEKAENYEKAGVKEYWVVDIEKRGVTIHLLEKGGHYQKKMKKDGRLGSRQIPGFYVQIDWLWQDPISAFDCLKKILKDNAPRE